MVAVYQFAHMGQGSLGQRLMGCGRIGGGAVVVVVVAALVFLKDQIHNKKHAPFPWFSCCYIELPAADWLCMNRRPKKISLFLPLSLTHIHTSIKNGSHRFCRVSQQRRWRTQDAQSFLHRLWQPV
jgi:hypothetical protein